MHKYEIILKSSEIYRTFSYIAMYGRIILKRKLLEFEGVE